MKKLLCYLLFAICYLLFAVPFTLSPIFAAEVEVYPGGVGTQANVTSEGWTDNRGIGQSFTPSNVSKITKITLSNFKIGMKDQNNGGVVTVSLYQGEPTVRTVGPSNYQVTEVSPTGPLIARVEKVYIPGWKLSHWFADLCGAGRNSAEDYLLKRIRINNPDKPCPRVWIHNGLPGTGESDLLGPADVNDPIYGGESVFYGPSWEAHATGWQSDTTLTVNLPSNGIVPGQTYFLWIQEEYLRSQDYYEEYKHNCLGPTLLYDNSGAVISNRTEVCDKEHVFVAWIDTKNPYAGGRAYFNTFYYMNPGSYNRETGDLTNLKIWGNQAFPPTASITGPTAGQVGQTLTYTATASDKDGNLTRGEIWVARADPSLPGGLLLWTSACPGGGSPPRKMSGSWCNLADTPLSGGGPVSFSGSWTPSATGSYYVVVNAFDSSGLRCTGNPQYSFNGGAIVRTDWSNCYSNGDPLNPPNDFIKVNIIETVGLSIQYGNNPNVTPTTFQGAPKTSGLQTADGGSNWYNYLSIAETAYSATGRGQDIDSVAVSFVPGQPAQVTTFSTALSQANEGFVVAYAQGYNSLRYPNGEGFPTIPGHYYVYYNGWKDMDNPVTVLGGEVNFCIDKDGNTSKIKCGSDGKIQVTSHYKVGSNCPPQGNQNDSYVCTSGNSLTVKWDVYTWSSFTSKQLNIYGYGRRGDTEGFLSEEQVQSGASLVL